MKWIRKGKYTHWNKTEKFELTRMELADLCSQAEFVRKIDRVPAYFEVVEKANKLLMAYFKSKEFKDWCKEFKYCRGTKGTKYESQM